MTDLTHDMTDMMPRRGFFGRFTGAMVLGLAGFATTPVRAETAAAPSDGPDWPGVLKGRHRQVVDAYDANSGFPLAFAYSFLAPNAGAATAVVVLRHGAFPIALGSEMWQKYKIGEAFKILDPETKAPAVKNPFLQPKPGVLLVDDMAVDRLLANGTVIGGCNLAACAEQDARRQRRRERRRSRQGMGRKCGPGHHHHSIRNMGGEPRAGSRLHVLRGWLIFDRDAPNRKRRCYQRRSGAPARETRPKQPVRRA